VLTPAGVSPNSRAAIGVFDSGVGGLTVFKALAERLPHERMVYLGDTARVPYGTKSPEVVTRYSLGCARELLQHELKALVVACNTASALALDALEAQLPVPVVGVIAPGAAAAAAATKSRRVAVIATPATIASGAYQRALHEARADLEVRAKACPLFVPLAEEGWTQGDVPRLVAREYLGQGFVDGADTLVLGCTHYPLLRDIIAEAVGPKVTLVDSAHATAEHVAGLLEKRGLLAPVGNAPERHFLVTDTPARFVEIAGRFLGQPIAGAQQVDLKLA